MEEKLKQIIESYYSVNSKVVTPTRLLFLSLLKFHKEGLQFREFKESIQISDGNLYSNLEILKSFSFITSEKIEIDNKLIEVYNITPKGQAELKKTQKWLKNLQEFGDQIEA